MWSLYAYRALLWSRYIYFFFFGNLYLCAVQDKKKKCAITICLFGGGLLVLNTWICVERVCVCTTLHNCGYIKSFNKGTLCIVKDNSIRVYYWVGAGILHKLLLCTICGNDYGLGNKDFYATLVYIWTTGP